MIVERSAVEGLCNQTHSDNMFIFSFIPLRFKNFSAPVSMVNIFLQTNVAGRVFCLCLTFNITV